MWRQCQAATLRPRVRNVNGCQHLTHRRTSLTDPVALRVLHAAELGRRNALFSLRRGKNPASANTYSPKISASPSNMLATERDVPGTAKFGVE